MIQYNNEFHIDLYNAMDFVNENTGWIAGDRRIIGTGCFIIKTTNGGLDWQTQYSSPSGTFRDIKFTDENTGYAVGQNGIILKTTDGGVNWINKNPAQNYSLNKIQFTDAKNGWASGRNFDSGIIIKTTDGGENWMDVTPAFSIPSSYALYFVDSLIGWVDADGFTAGEGYILKTTDGGINWIIQRQAYEMYFNSLYAKNEEEIFAGGWDPELKSSLIYSTDGGISWSANNSPIIGGVEEIKFVDDDHGWFISLRGVYNTTDGGITWKPQKSYSKRVLTSIDFVNNNLGWIAGYFGTILHTNNGGVTFVKDKEESLSAPNDINIYQNYPNPFNPNTTIRINLNSETDEAELAIYNLLGQKIKVLHNGILYAGEQEFTWDGKDGAGKDVSTGIYFSVFKSEEKVWVKKCLS